MLDMFGAATEAQNKRERVNAAIKLVDRQDLVPLVEELLELLRHDGAFDRSNPYAADDTKRQQLAESLSSYGITLLETARPRRICGGSSMLRHFQTTQQSVITSEG